ncbi:MAG: efflux RND transporter periplasmic adaptor subunit [Acidobacteria bacterium]|nr:efflux RND transporter periplasmic adaptor subunit [Acidobacteriota bacterium]
MSKSKFIKKALFRTTGLFIVLAGAWYAYAFFRDLPKRQEQIATTKVRQGDVIVRSFTRGELRAVRSATLAAPNLFGTVQVTRIAPLGAFAREKDLVVEFDDSEVNSRLEEKQLELEQIDEQIKKNTADLEMRDNQDQVDLLSARYAVRRAELEVKRNELLAAIDAKKNVLNLEEAKRRLQQLESDIKSRREQAQAQLAVLRENKNKGLLELQREKARLQQVKLLAPISGLVAVRQNRTGFMFPGMQIPDIREGDQVQPGIPVADVLDLSEMEILAKVGELDRANLQEGQEASIVLDALPEKRLNGRIKSMSGTATSNAFSFDPAKKFDVVFSVEMKELLAALGAKPEQVQAILATAEQNRKKPVTAAAPPMMMAGGQMPSGGGDQGQMGGMQQSGMGMQQQGGGMGQPGEARQGGERRRGAGGFAGMQNLTPEQRQKVQEAIKKALGGKSMQELSAEERAAAMPKVQAAVAEVMKQAGGQQKAAAGAAGAAGGPPTMGFAGGPGGPGGMPMMMGMGGGSRYTEKELASAKLPPPPEEDTQFDVLLRPGLLADVEIIVEKIPNAINVPMQAVFEREGRPVVYVRSGAAFEPRIIKPFKRSESVMVIAEGLKPGEVVALADPTAKKTDSKNAKKTDNGGAMSALPGGGK